MRETIEGCWPRAVSLAEDLSAPWKSWRCRNWRNRGSLALTLKSRQKKGRTVRTRMEIGDGRAERGLAALETKQAARLWFQLGSRLGARARSLVLRLGKGRR